MGLMSNLVVVGFPKVEEAEDVRRELVGIQQEHLIALEDAVVLEHAEDGHVHLRQAINLAARGAFPTPTGAGGAGAHQSSISAPVESPPRLSTVCWCA